MKRLRLAVVAAALMAILAAVASIVLADATLNSIAESYVKLVLRVGVYDAEAVDSYFGPEEWRPASRPADSASPPYGELLAEAKSLAARLEKSNPSDASELAEQRRINLATQLRALVGRIEMRMGKVMAFDVETRTLYDLELPAFREAYYDSLLNELNKLLPGEGSVAKRYNAYQAQLKVPSSKVEEVFNAGVAAARERVARYIDLPEADSVSIEIVRDRWWTANCRYQGHGHSHMELNIDNPFYLDEAITFPCHELYPGHHLSHLFVDNYLHRENGWTEFCILPTFSPLAALMEGTAEYGIDLTFPRTEWIEFAKSVVCPIAGIDTSLVEPFYDMWRLKYQLYPVESHIARQYLHGDIDADEAKARLLHYAIYGEDEVDDRINAYDDYRSYVVNYYEGKNLVYDHVRRAAGDSADRNALWSAFSELLRAPATPSNLQDTRSR